MAQVKPKQSKQGKQAPAAKKVIIYRDPSRLYLFELKQLFK